MKCISYSIFGNPSMRHENCFDFHSYLRGLMVNIRLNRLIFPEWDTVVHVSQSTFELYEDLFNNIGNLKNVRVVVCEDAPLCLAMLWRLKPIFEKEENGNWKYTHVICRDVDSPTLYKDAQCVSQWIRHDKAAHAITDSISHTIPMMGGMIGFRPGYFTDRTGCNTWEDAIRIGRTRDFKWNTKGSDQEYLNQILYPLFAQQGFDSITQHYLKGCPNTWLGDYHCTLPNETLTISDSMKESNDIAGHIGAAGYYEGPLLKFLNKYTEQFRDIKEVEKDYKDIFIIQI